MVWCLPRSAQLSLAVCLLYATASVTLSMVCWNTQKRPHGSSRRPREHAAQASAPQKRTIPNACL
jgi:hypothetical protein